MVKRKGSGTESASIKKVKKDSDSNGCGVTTKIDFTDSESVIKSLLGPTSLNLFFQDYWEKKPLVLKREERDYYGDLFSLESMKEIFSNNELMFESDVNVCRYIDNEKELLNEDGKVTSSKCDELMTEKQATFQLHQPQRYTDSLWNLMSKLESYFGCLVGSNVYITPKDSQGLAPHCDDVEIFVLQLEGKKTWKLYKPMVELSRDYTQDLLQEDIGKPIIEHTMEPGDLLYFPRGTIHQAKSVGDEHSTHITISTYQHNTIGDFMNTAVSQAIENALDSDVSFRSGLPINYLSFLGTQKNMGKYVDIGDENELKFATNKENTKVKKFKEVIKAQLSKLIDHIDVDTAADEFSYDYMSSRLPPHGYVAPDEEEMVECPLTIDSKIRLRYPEHVRMLYHDQEEEDDEVGMVMKDDEDESFSDIEGDTKSVEKKDFSDEKPSETENQEIKPQKKRDSLKSSEDLDDDDEEATITDDGPCIKVIHSLKNDRETHMSGGGEFDSPEVTALKFPIHFAHAITAIVNNKDFIALKDLPLEDDEEKLRLAKSFYGDDLLECQ